MQHFVVYLTFCWLNHIILGETRLKMQEKVDLRIKKTKRILFDALIRLMAKKNFEKIKVSDICEEALINRSTFYAHYEDKYDLLVDLFEDQTTTLLKEFEDNENVSFSKEYLMKLLSILMNYIDENRDLFYTILNNNRDGILIDFLIDAIEKDFAARLKNNHDMIVSDIPLDLVIKFYSGGLINVGIAWLTQKDKYTKEQLFDYIDKLIPETI
jgi:Transcriptional regulator